MGLCSVNIVELDTKYKYLRFFQKSHYNEKFLTIFKV